MRHGRPIDHFWRTDLLLFQSVFALDILLRMVRLRRRFPGLSWRDALLRRWIDLPLLLPFWRWLRLVPVVERLSQARPDQRRAAAGGGQPVPWWRCWPWSCSRCWPCSWWMAPSR
jgi:hypothetical protein